MCCSGLACPGLACVGLSLLIVSTICLISRRHVRYQTPHTAELFTEQFLINGTGLFAIFHMSAGKKHQACWVLFFPACATSGRNQESHTRVQVWPKALSHASPRTAMYTCLLLTTSNIFQLQVCTLAGATETCVQSVFELRLRHIANADPEGPWHILVLAVSLFKRVSNFQIYRNVVSALRGAKTAERELVGSEVR